MTHWINTPAALNARLTQLPTSIGLDTEFIRERTYWPQLALVQIALGSTEDDILLVDPLAAGMTDALAPLLTNPHVLKLMHSPSEDLVAFQHTCGVLPQPLFDTQTAAALCGLGAGLSYQKLVLAILEVELSKGETRSDWLRRPLSEAQLKYAADDVHFLHRIHRALQEKLNTLHRSAWLHEDCARQVSNAANDAPERWPHLALRGAQFLDASAQHRLLRLLRWRDQQARNSDRPRSWILDNELAITLARQNPPDRNSMNMLLDAAPKSPRSLRDALWSALSTPLADEQQAPALRTEERDKKQLRTLQQVVLQAATALNIPEGTLASRKLLESLQDGNGWTGPLAGWRKQVLEPLITPLLQQ